MRPRLVACTGAVRALFSRTTRGAIDHLTIQIRLLGPGFRQAITIPLTDEGCAIKNCRFSRRLRPPVSALAHACVRRASKAVLLPVADGTCPECSGSFQRDS